MTECTICYGDGTEAPITLTPCCDQSVHRTCLDKWLRKSHECMFCREIIGSGELELDSDDGLLPEAPQRTGGYINVNIAGNLPAVYMEAYSGSNAPDVRVIDHEQVLYLPEVFLNDTLVILENGKYANVLNLPVGWILSINGRVVREQESRMVYIDEHGEEVYEGGAIDDF